VPSWQIGLDTVSRQHSMCLKHARKTALDTHPATYEASFSNLKPRQGVVNHVYARTVYYPLYSNFILALSLQSALFDEVFFSFPTRVVSILFFFFLFFVQRNKQDCFTFIFLLKTQFLKLVTQFTFCGILCCLPVRRLAVCTIHVFVTQPRTHSFLAQCHRKNRSFKVDCVTISTDNAIFKACYSIYFFCYT
jgi:hypothetical protein